MKPTYSRLHLDTLHYCRKDIPLFQCQMSLSGPKSVREVDGLSLIFIDFYVPALTPRLNRCETSMQISENITFFEITEL
jgi:hypothetical protein